MNVKLAIIFSLVGTTLIGLTVAFAPASGPRSQEQVCCEEGKQCCEVECDPENCVPCDDEACAEACKDKDGCCVVVCCDESACPINADGKAQAMGKSCEKASSACCSNSVKKS